MISIFLKKHANFDPFAFCKEISVDKFNIYVSNCPIFGTFLQVFLFSIHEDWDVLERQVGCDNKQDQKVKKQPPEVFCKKRCPYKFLKTLFTEHVWATAS